MAQGAIAGIDRRAARRIGGALRLGQARIAGTLEPGADRSAGREPIEIADETGKLLAVRRRGLAVHAVAETVLDADPLIVSILPVLERYCG